MSRQDPYEITRCACGHLETFHALNDGGQRRKCTASTCDCPALARPEGATRA